MGKSRTIKILGNIIGNLVVHKILTKHTNKPESIHHLKSEIDAYRDNSLEIASEYNWNEKDKAQIKEISLKNFEKDMSNHYADVKFPKEEVPALIKETINELL
ncbi:hypothetical protein J4463_02325 [Candidatus Pacearchaeota archaeon]|nr:hypothetical protein [Candidatus Pacearchaeota archaeon]